jgi:hypothetical protein
MAKKLKQTAIFGGKKYKKDYRVYTSKLIATKVAKNYRDEYGYNAIVDKNKNSWFIWLRPKLAKNIKFNDRDIDILKDLRIPGSQEDIDKKFDYHNSMQILYKLKNAGYVTKDPDDIYQTNKKGNIFLKKIKK